MRKSLAVTAQFRYCHRYRKYLKRLLLINDYLSLHGLLFDSQYRFRKHYSTELAALELTNRIRHEIDQKKVPFAVFLDLSKACDTLNHDILLTKLKYYGIKNTPLDWFKSCGGGVVGAGMKVIRVRVSWSSSNSSNSVVGYCSIDISNCTNNKNKAF